jgi:hypothetical protein
MLQITAGHVPFSTLAPLLTPAGALRGSTLNTPERGLDDLINR